MANNVPQEHSLIPQVEKLVTDKCLSGITYFKNPLGGAGALKHTSSVVQIVKENIPDLPGINPEIAILGAWLHDSGWIWFNKETPDLDHAVRGEIVAKEILSNLNTPPELLESVVKAVRRHRNKDISPETLEEKLVAASDSASHMIDGAYENIMEDESLGNLKERAKYCFEKLQRDKRDMNLIPQVFEKFEARFNEIEAKIQTVY